MSSRKKSEWGSTVWWWAEWKECGGGNGVVAKFDAQGVAQRARVGEGEGKERTEWRDMARGMARQGQQKENMTSQPSPSHEQSGDEKSGRSSENESEYSDDETYDDDIKPHNNQNSSVDSKSPTNVHCRPTTSTTPSPLTTPPPLHGLHHSTLNHHPYVR